MGCLTAVVDGNVSGRVLHKAVVRRRCPALDGLAEGVAEEVDGVALEAEPDVGVHRRSHADVGIAQQLLDHDEFDALLQEECGCRVPEVVEADAAEGGPAEQGVEVPGEGGPLDRGAVGPSEDVAARLPARPRSLALLKLPVAAVRGSANTRWAGRCAVPSCGSW